MDIVDNMSTSSFPVAIGTGLMLESIFQPVEQRIDDTREPPVFININSYKYHIYNIYTIIRNMLHANSYKNKSELLLHKKFKSAIVNEVESIFSIYDGYDCQPVLFKPDYTRIIEYMNKNKVKETSSSIILYKLMESVLDDVEFNNVDIISKSDMPTPYKLPVIQDDYLITTSYTVDLYNNRKYMKLMESHTGKLKSNLEFSSKYKKSKMHNVSLLPFNEKIHYLIGDDTLVIPIKLSFRKLLFEIAKKKKWDVTTTNDKIMMNLKDNSEELYQLIVYYSNLYS